jgi:hypothetical protein
MVTMRPVNSSFFLWSAFDRALDSAGESHPWVLLSHVSASMDLESRS